MVTESGATAVTSPVTPRLSQSARSASCILAMSPFDITMIRVAETFRLSTLPRARTRSPTETSPRAIASPLEISVWPGGMRWIVAAVCKVTAYSLPASVFTLSVRAVASILVTVPTVDCKAGAAACAQAAPVTDIARQRTAKPFAGIYLTFPFMKLNPLVKTRRALPDVTPAAPVFQVALYGALATSFSPTDGRYAPTVSRRHQVPVRRRVSISVKE